MHFTPILPVMQRNQGTEQYPQRDTATQFESPFSSSVELCYHEGSARLRTKKPEKTFFAVYIIVDCFHFVGFFFKTGALFLATHSSTALAKM